MWIDPSIIYLDISKKEYGKNFYSWKNKFLSQAGNEVLIKALIQAIPTFPLSFFKLPKKLCKEITTLMSKFWQGSQVRIEYIGRAELKLGNKKKGLGIGDVECFSKDACQIMLENAKTTSLLGCQSYKGEIFQAR